MFKLLLLLCMLQSGSAQDNNLHPVVVINTNQGPIVLTLDAEKAPITVANFLSYAERSFYNGTIFHRVIPGFMIQAGGYTTDLRKKTAKKPIRNEAGNGLRNKRYTIAMARSKEINSATCQFYINVVDNESLDHRSNSEREYGYAVFGEVTMGFDTVEAIAATPTRTVGTYKDVPVTPVIIESMTVVK